MKYFLHDSNSFIDEKITELFLKFGYEGLGLFYTILEKVAYQEKPIKTNVLKSQLYVGKKLDKCWEFMESIGLISSNNGETFNERILSYSETYQIKKQKNKDKISQWREKQSDIKNVTSHEPVSNASKVKESKEKENKEIDIICDKSPTQKTFKNFSENDFIEEIKKYSEGCSKENLNNFFLYWKERSPGGKMKFQLEKTWETNLRLKKWISNQPNFSNGTNTKNFTGNSKQNAAGNFLNMAKQEFKDITGRTEAN